MKLVPSDYIIQGLRLWHYIKRVQGKNFRTFSEVYERIAVQEKCSGALINSSRHPNFT